MKSKAIKNFSPIHINDLTELKLNLEKTLNELGITEYDYIGSVGKKEWMNDIDIAVIGDIFVIQSKLEEKGIEFKLALGFNQISFAHNFNNEIVQVDLMFTQNLEWTKFMFYSPNFIQSESHFKGVYRNLLFADILRTETKNWINKTDYNQLTIQFTKGLFLTSKTHLSEKGNWIKTPRVLQTKLITNDYKEFLQILRLNELSFTFEQVYAQLKDRSLETEIKRNFKETCNNFKIDFNE